MNETLKEAIGNGIADDRFNDGVNAVITLMELWFDGYQLDEFLTFIVSKEITDVEFEENNNSIKII